jgi:hypothetical protein
MAPERRLSDSLYNAFFEGKKAVIRKGLWQGRSGAVLLEEATGDSEGYQVREGQTINNGLFEVEKSDIGHQNAYFWNINPE